MLLRQSAPADPRLSVAEAAVVWLVPVAAVAVLYWGRLDESFASPDNLMRLVQVRALLDGAPWFDPHEPRFAPPLGYDTHWSRLIDGGIAGLILLFRQFASPDLAERLARCVWPLLLSGPAVFAVAAIAARLGGAGAGRAAMLAAMPTLALLTTFRPGEIDHHNAQVTLSLVLIACAVWCERRYLAAAAGIAGGLLFSIGLEAAYVPALVTAVFGLLLVRSAAWAAPARDFGAALAVTTLCLYLATTPAALRFTPECDALAINSALAVATGAAGLAVIAAISKWWPPTARLFAFLVTAVLVVGIFAAYEPRCLRGPFGLIDRSIFTLWLDKVAEMQPLRSVFHTDAVQGAVCVAFPLVALLSALWVARAGLATPLAWALIAALALAEVIMIGQVRILVYVTWLGLPFVGVAAFWLAERTRRPALIAAMAAVLASPAVVALMVSALASQVAHAKDPHQTSEETLPCYLPGSFHELGALPPGLVMAPLDLGPAILAHTRHSIVAAPYHRADRAIRFNQETMNGPSAAARPRIAARGADYVVACSAFAPDAIPGSFHESLFLGVSGPWLEPVPHKDGDPISIWRVRTGG